MIMGFRRLRKFEKKQKDYCVLRNVRRCGVVTDTLDDDVMMMTIELFGPRQKGLMLLMLKRRN